MSALTRTDLVNLALREIGTWRVEDWTENSPEADVAKDVWPQAVRMALSRHPWRFAMKGAELVRQATPPTTGEGYAYTLPPDFVRLGLLSPYATMRPRLEQWTLLADGIVAETEQLFAEYVYDAPPIGVWPAWFVDVFTADLASLMASPLKSTTERERLEQLANQRLATARAIDSQQSPVAIWRPGRWLAAKRGGWSA